MSNCQKCTKVQKKFKSLQNDLQFQIKKLNQDMATLKITLQLAHQRQLKKNVDKLQQQKSAKQGQLKCWMVKYDTMISQYQDKLLKLQKQHEKDIHKIKEQALGSTLTQMKLRQSKILQQKDLQKKKYEQQRRLFLQKRSQQLKKQQKKHTQAINALLSKHNKETQALNQQIKRLNQILKLKDKNITCGQDDVAQLKHQIKYLSEQQTKLKQQLHDSKVLLKVKLEMKQKEITASKQETTQKIKKLQKAYQKQKQQVASENKKKIKNILQNSVKSTYQIQQKLLQLRKIRQNDLKIYNSNVQQLKRIAQDVYMPKNKFDQQINHLNVKLINKQKDVQRVKNQVKQCKLEIVNKEDTIIKFFPGGQYGNTGNAPEIVIRTPNSTQKKKDYSIKRNKRGSFHFNPDASPLFKIKGHDEVIKLNLNKTANFKTSSTNLQNLLVPEMTMDLCSVDSF